jgi:hypothetical protein
MRSIALPLRITPQGRFVEQEGFDAILGLVQVMAGTSSRAWPHAPWFGLLEAFIEAARRDRTDHEGLKDAINAALGNLGVEGYRVQSITTGPLGVDGRRAFRLTMESPEGKALFGEMAAG